MKSPKDGLQVYALTFADERAQNGILTISRCPFNMKGRGKAALLAQERLKSSRDEVGGGATRGRILGGGDLNQERSGWAGTLGLVHRERPGLVPSDEGPLSPVRSSTHTALWFGRTSCRHHLVLNKYAAILRFFFSMFKPTR